jgi:ABC-type multidrug transport system fused ATPase/permease subunit
MNKKRRLFIRWLGYVRHYSGWMALSMVAVIAVILIDLTAPRVFAFVVDVLLAPASRVSARASLPLLGEMGLGQAFICVGAFLALLVLCKAVLQFCKTMLLSLVGEHIHLEIRGSLFEHIHRLPISYFDSSFTGKIMARVTTDADALWGLLYNGVNGVVAPLLSLTLILIVVATTAPALSLVLLLVLPVFAILYFWAKKRNQSAIRNQRETLSSIYARLQEQISGVRTVRTFGMAGEESSRFMDILKRLYGHNMALMKTIGTLGSLSDVIVGLGTALVLCLGGSFAARGAISVGQLVQFYAYAGMLFVPIQTIANTLAQTFSQAEIALERIFELMDQEEAKEFSGGMPCPPLEGAIEIENVDFSYDGKKPVLRELSLSIPARSAVAIVGPSGAGKTSLINLICRFYDFQKGRVLLDGIDITTIEATSFRAQVGYVSQDSFLFSGSIFENLQYAKPDATMEEVREAARIANADDFIRAMPEGYDTILGERGVKLSGGQRQRINIARALLRRPRILILDEPTSSLDAESESIIIEAMGSSFRDLTRIIIAHRLSTVMAADYIYVLDDGRLVQQGRHAELAAVDGLYRTLCSKQFISGDRETETDLS